MECEKVLLGSSQHLVILSDFNSDSTANSSPWSRFLHSFMGQFNLHELVQCPTRVTATTSSHLDLILTNSPSHFQATTAMAVVIIIMFSLIFVIERYLSVC